MFTPVRTYEPLRFDSGSICVDEENSTVFVVNEGDLIRLPF